MIRRVRTMKELRSLMLNFWPVAIVILCAVSSVSGQTVDAVRVVAQPLDRNVALPGEFVPYLSVPIHAKITGFVQKVEVDRGSFVKEGQLLATMVAPELNAQRAEARAQVRTAEAQK